MANHVYKLEDLVGSSSESPQRAIENAIAHASAPASQLRWFEVLETRGQLQDGKVAHWQVMVRIGSTRD
ncbi:MAG TPA: dodecin [Polyangiales bacterium]